MTDTMRAAQLLASGRIECVSAPVPRPGPQEVLVQTLAATICGSDLHVVNSRLGADSYPCRCGFPGHEAVGRIAESRVDGLDEGTIALLVPDLARSCMFADFACVRGEFVIPVPTASAPLEIVVAQQLGTVIFALRRFWPHGAPEVATVIGTGPAGLMFIELLKLAGCGRIICADLAAHRIEEGRRRGADVGVLASKESVVEATRDSTNGRGADLVIEAAGRDATRAQAIECVAVDGTVGLFGLPERPGDAPLPLGSLFARRPTIQVSIGTQHEPGLRSFRRALAMLAGGRVGRSLISHAMPIDQIAEGFRLAAERSEGALKVAFCWPDD